MGTVISRRVKIAMAKIPEHWKPYINNVVEGAHGVRIVFCEKAPITVDEIAEWKRKRKGEQCAK